MNLQDTLSNQVQKLEDSKKIKIYLCGVTVYDESHIGHARTIIVFDVLRKYLESKKVEVEFIQNFTDVDDKIINRATTENTSAEEISSRYIKNYFRDFDGLNIKRATNYPKATEHIEDIIKFVEKLIGKKYAYVSKNGVYFSVSKFPEYGKLSKKKIDELQSGSRIQIDETKKDPLDFAVWKFSDTNPTWESPWGKGRPGWHIECSAMSVKYLGENFDIHGGGRDLIFPHHENEIAQSECISGKKFANYWIHNGLININKEKMSKSIGNIVNIKEGLKVWDKNIFRILFLTHHYRTPVDLSNKKLAEVGKSLLNLKKKLEINESSSSNFKELWVSAMLDDFNTAKALGYYFKFINDGKLSNKSTVELEEFEETMGISGWRNDISNPTDKNPINKEEIEELIIERNKARSEKDWVKADKLRERAEELGIKLLDNDEGTIWE